MSVIAGRDLAAINCWQAQASRPRLNRSCICLCICLVHRVSTVAPRHNTGMTKPRYCDIFCAVIDNFGDIGICWRLACDLALREWQVRLWVDDASALQWMAPAGFNGVQVMAWAKPLNLADLQLVESPPALLIEAFGCEIPPEFLAACAQIDWAKDPKPAWINLEYLTAESYAERNHALPSPVPNGPAAGWIKHFFYPGFTPQTGGLLREPDLTQRQAAFNRKDWLHSQGIKQYGEVLVSLFCYEPPGLARLLNQLANEGLNGQPVHLLVAAGRAQRAVDAAMSSKDDGKLYKNKLEPYKYIASLLSVSYLPLLTQIDFDHLLWACDVNFVRGEDSIVRALWAGKPFVWQIYPQDDGVHRGKLDAFLDMLKAPQTLRAFHHYWNAEKSEIDLTEKPVPDLGKDLPCWQQTAQ